MSFHLLVWMALLQPLAAPSEAPVFTSASVVPANANPAGSLQPGMLISIYGRNLGPARGCTPEPGRQREPAELCGATVTVNGEKAALLYVQERQINLRVPHSIAPGEKLPIVVTYRGLSSGTVPVQFARQLEPANHQVEVARISLLGRAYVHMPVWIAVSLPERHQRSVRYPITTYPDNLGGHDFEVRKDGQDLPKLHGTKMAPMSFVGLMAPRSIGGGSLLGLPHEPREVGRLPLHLLFHLDEPGRYQVRYTGYDRWSGATATPLVRSGWLTIDVEAYSEKRRSAWIEELRRTAPNDSVELLSDYLPSALAWPDSEALSIVESFLYHRDELVRKYAMYSLYLFDDAEVVAWMPGVLRRLGPTPELAYFLSWRRDLFQPGAYQVRRYVSQHLRSDSNLVTSGSLQALGFLKAHYDWTRHPKAVAKMDALVMERAGSLLNSHSREVLQTLALYLGSVKTDRSRQLLWRLVEKPGVRGHALICLTWIGDRRDLPRLATYLDKYHLEDPLKRAYGQAAAPYLGACPRNIK